MAVAGLHVSGAGALRRDGRYVLLDRLQDPGNMGTIVRICCAFALTGVILTPGCVDPFAPKVVRAAAGGIGALDIIRIASLDEVRALPLIAADAGGSDVAGFAWPESFVLAVGNEAGGLSPEVRRAAAAVVAVPMTGCMESLNAAVSAGILLYCATRPRRG
jgi:TrmH family RNA methyltransferase